MPNISVLVSHGVYNVFIDMSTMQPISFSCKEEIPELAMPSSFNSLADLQNTFLGYELNLVGEVVQDSQNAVSNAPTFEELHAIEENKQLIDEGLKRELINIFRIKYYELSSKKKSNKDYLNGMAKVILYILPHLKSQLLAITDNTDNERDLL